MGDHQPNQPLFAGSVPQHGLRGDVPHGTLFARPSHATAKGVGPIAPFALVLTKLHEASDALGQAQNTSDYQAIGMRCREALLAFVGACQDVAEWTSEGTLKRADFRAWSELICNVALAGADQKNAAVY